MTEETRIELSAAAHAAAEQRLPGLLGMVRARRRRRQFAQAVAAGVVVALALLPWWWPGPAPAALGVPVPHGSPIAATRPGEWIRDRADVLARAAVQVAPRPEWYVDDAGLHELLLRSARQPGLVRARGHVFVRPEAVDPFPRAQP